MTVTTSNNIRSRSRQTLAALVAASVLALAGCGGSDGSAVSNSAPAGGSIADLVVDEPAPSGDAGSCTVTSTGAIQSSFTSGGGAMAVTSDYWLPEGVVSPLEPVALIVTCDGGDGTLLTLSKVSVDDLPFAPGSVELQPLEIGLFTPDALASPSAPVTLQLDAFDAMHIAGNATFEATDSSGGVSNVSVDFDLANPTAG